METHVNKKGQIVIPSILRKKYGIKEGKGRFYCFEADNKSTHQEVAGFFEGHRDSKSINSRTSQGSRKGEIVKRDIAQMR